MHIASAATSRATRQRSFLVLLALLVTLLSACSAVIPPPGPLPELHLPGVSEIPGVSTLHPGVGRGDISGLGSAIGTLDITTNPPIVLFRFDSDLYRIGFDGGDPMPLGRDCRDSGGSGLSTTADGRWLLCPAYPDQVTLVPLPAAAPHETEHTLHPLTPSGSGITQIVGNVTISPDGRYLALLTGEFGGRSIALYSLSAAYDQVSLAAIICITSDRANAQLGVSGTCNFHGPAWSPDGPDGPWLAFTCEYRCGVFMFPLQPYLQQTKSSSQLMSFILDPAKLVSVAQKDYAEPYPSWILGPDGLRLNYIVGPRVNTIEQLSLSTRQTRALVKIPSEDYRAGILDGLAPAPNYRSLIFIHSRTPPCVECQPGETPSHLYSYFSADA